MRRPCLIALLLISLAISLFYGQVGLAQSISHTAGYESAHALPQCVDITVNDPDHPADKGWYFDPDRGVWIQDLTAAPPEYNLKPTDPPPAPPEPVEPNPAPTDPPAPSRSVVTFNHYTSSNTLMSSTSQTFQVSSDMEVYPVSPYVLSIPGYTFDAARTASSFTVYRGSSTTVNIYYKSNEDVTPSRTPIPTPTKPGPGPSPTNPKPPTPQPQPPTPTQPIWDDFPTVPVGDETEDWDPGNGQNGPIMIIHVLDRDSDESLGPDIVIPNLPMGTEVMSSDIAPDIPGYVLDTSMTPASFIQNNIFAENGLFYGPDYFGDLPHPFDWGFGFDPKPYEIPEDGPHGTPEDDPLCPDCPGQNSVNDPTSPWFIPDAPSQPCVACKQGTLCEQVPVGTCDPLPNQFVVKPSASNAFPQPSKTQKAGKLTGIKWDERYGVIVYGFDLAGAVTALTAAEQGATVVLIDKAPAEEIGGYARYTAQNLIFAKDKAEFRKFVDAWNEGFDHVEPAILDAYANGAERLPHWLVEHGAHPYLMPRVQYDELDGSAGAGLLRLSEKASYDQAVFKLVVEAMQPYNRKQIFYMGESQVTDLLQDPKTRTVVGVKVHSNKLNKDFNFRAKGGVVLAGGGFENNEEMIEDNLVLPKIISKYAKWDDGDAIKLAMRAGAELWHMGNVSGYELHLKEVTDHLQYRNPLQGLKQYQLGGRSCFVVGADGRRFMDEGALVRSGHVYQNDEWRIQQLPQEAWAILDHEGLTKLPLAQHFSEDNMQEVADGEILEAADLESLAQALKIDPEALEQQFMDYQEFCDYGYDPQCGRRSENLFALSEEGPYYAVSLAPVLEATLGGPERNASCEIMDTKGEIISHLFGAGSLGSIFPNIFPQGADLTEAIISGQIAGSNAAKLAKGK